MQAYCFRFYFLLVTVIIFGGIGIKGDKVFESPPLAQLTPGTSSSSSSAAPMASSGPAMATIPATSTDLPGKEDTNHVDVEQQNAERRQDETVELSPEVPTTRPREDRR